MSDWIRHALSALIGGLVVALGIAFRVGREKQRLDDAIRQASELKDRADAAEEAQGELKRELTELKITSQQILTTLESQGREAKHAHGQIETRLRNLEVQEAATKERVNAISSTVSRIETKLMA
jgi:chromosome segregation ATPase